MATALQSREEVVQEDALARLHFPALAFRWRLLLMLSGGVLRGAAPPRTDSWDVLGVYLSPLSSSIPRLAFGQHATRLRALG